MAQQTYAYAQETRDPRTAAMLSMIPGLGQFYNGESRKGMLFLDVALINYALLSVMLLAPAISDLMKNFGTQFGMKVNHGVLDALEQMHFGSPVSLVVLGMVLAFVGYAVRDAYDHATLKRRRAIYSDAIIGLNEATSGAYIIHASIIVSLAVMALFFFIPKPLAKQITEIEIFTSVPKPVTIVKPIKVTPISNTNNEAHIRKFDPVKPLQKVPPKSELKPTQPSNKEAAATAHNSPAASSSSSAAAAHPQIKPIEQAVAKSNPVQAEKPTLLAFTPAAVLPHTVSSVNPAKAMPQPLTATPAASASNLLPKPVTSGGASVPMPVSQAVGVAPANPFALPSQLPAGSLPHLGSGPAMPSLAAPSGASRNGFALPGISAPHMGGSASGTPQIGPRGPATSAGGPSTSTGAPGIMQIPTHTGTDGGPQPEARTPGSGSKHGTGKKNGTDIDGDTDVPAPQRARRSGGEGPIRLIPTAGPSSDQSGPGSTPLNMAAPRGADQGASTKNPDFTAYMDALQRQIRRAWFPPKDLQKRRVKVMFKVHTGGELSNLRISESSGFPTADQAALKAVESAAPFRHLPQFSPENVDIEFTFDYNVFNSAM